MKLLYTLANIVLSVAFMRMTKAHINPDRGMYHHLETFASEFEPVTATMLSEYDDVSIIKRLYYLDFYKNGPLDDSFIENVRSDMQAFREGGKRVVLRFAYGEDSDDPSEDIILGHIDQLTDTLHDSAASLLAFDAGFIGSWGEWYYSDSFGSPEDGEITKLQMESRYNIVRRMVDAVPAEVPVAVRWTYWYDELTALDSSLNGRLNFYDDCIYAPYNDLGLFDNESFTTHDMPFGTGGETCSQSYELDDCASFIANMERINATYVNLDYDKSKLKQYEQCGYQDRVGYLPTLEEHTVDCKEDSCSVSIFLKNSGFARPARSKSATIECDGTIMGAKLNFRNFFPGSTVAIKADVPTSTCGSLKLYLMDDQFTEDVRYSVAIDGADFDDDIGANMLSGGRSEEDSNKTTAEFNSAKDAALLSIDTSAEDDFDGAFPNESIDTNSSMMNGSPESGQEIVVDTSITRCHAK